MPSRAFLSDVATAFPEFLWGVATSGYQHEGGINGAGEPLNNWAWAERDRLVEISGRASNFWELAEADLERAARLGLNSFRLELSWSRIQPIRILPDPDRGAAPPPFDSGALERYAEILAHCRLLRLEPIVTLHHFTHPAWLGLDAWLHTETIDHYVAYVRHTVQSLLSLLAERHGVLPPRVYLTTNEPNMLAACHYLYGYFPTGPARGVHPAAKTLMHLLEAHIRAYRVIHDLYRDTPIRPLVGFNNYANNLYWLDQAWLDLLHCQHRGIPKQRIFSHLWENARRLDREFGRARFPTLSLGRRFLGSAIKMLQHFLAYACSLGDSWDRLVDVLYSSPRRPLDYIAFDYYDPFVEHAFRWPHWRDELPRQNKAFHEWLVEGFTSKWWDWHMLPEGLAFVVEQLRRFGLPLLIAENGIAYRGDASGVLEDRPDAVRRTDYIRAHVQTVTRLWEEGAPLFGYLYWSLVDNYEWGSYAPRFGLYSAGTPGSWERKESGLEGENPAQTYAEEVARARERMSRKTLP
ncbi:family 1 glycosylhydrolase [Methylacidimicrobium sp. AP8]|uniref:family 1 glycosylhydrolase n=1 Tax=Methylacidimicrobium sp. AP8 TaxID=2730359 RepID=UPI0019238415|nr:family 1 glycosylhydrolase [Methylacidimicrobium sp. AP8]